MHGPGTIILPCQEQARWHRFTHDLWNLDLPEGTGFSMGVGTSIVDNLNAALRTIPDESEWVWIIGDDHRFQKDVVMRLLDRDLDVVACLCASRQAPFALVHYDGELPHKDGPPIYSIVQYDELPAEPFPVTATGTTGMLIRRHVLEAVGDPWFKNSDTTTTNEDLQFCRKLRAAGFDIYIDPDCSLGHIGVHTAVPLCRDGKWGLVLDFGNGHSFWFDGGVKLDTLGRMEAPVG